MDRPPASESYRRITVGPTSVSERHFVAGNLASFNPRPFVAGNLASVSVRPFTMGAVDGWDFHRPFNFGGVGTMEFHRPFDVLGQPLDIAFHRPFNIIGASEWAFHRPFDVEGDLTWAFHRPFDVVGPQVSVGIGGNIGIDPSIPSTTLTAGVTVNDTVIAVASVTNIAPGAVIRVGTEVRVVESVSGSNVTLRQRLRRASSSGATVEVLSRAVVNGEAAPLSTAFVDGLLVFDKGGSFLGNIPVGWFTIDEAPSRTVSSSGSMQFHMARLKDGEANPYIDLVFDDRLVMVMDSIGSEPWLGSMTVQDWGGSQVSVTVPDAATLWGGPGIEIKETTSTETPASAVYQKVLDLMNAQRASDSEVVWDADFSTSEIFHGEITLEGDARRLFDQVARRSMTEYAWSARYEGGKARATLVVRDRFEASGFSISDGEGGNVESSVRLIVDPTPLVHTVVVRGRPSDLTTKSASCSTSGSIDCLDWMADSGGTAGPTTLIPEATASVDPGPRRRRETLEVELDWGLSSSDQQSAAADVTAQATALFHSYLRAFHDRYGRPFYSNDGWQYDGPPSELERFLTTGLGWRTALRLVEYQGQPASLVMLSDTQQQALLVLYDIQTGEKTVRRVWYTETGGLINATSMHVSGRTRVWTVVGGVITGYDYNNFLSSMALVGPPINYMFPGDGTNENPTTYKTLRRVVSLSEDGAVTEAMYFDSDQPFATPFEGAPTKSFSTVQLPSGVVSQDYIGKVYDFESRSICDWDPRRDGIGALLTKPTIVNNAPTTSPRNHFIPWGDGSGTTDISVGISETETQIYVSNAFVLPQAFPYVATLGTGLNSEDVNVTAGAGTLLTVTRGYNGTTAIIHPQGSIFAKKEDCDTEPEAEPDNSQTIPWPQGQVYADRLLEQLSNPARRITVQVTNKNNEWAQVQYGSLVDVNVASEGPPGGITGTWRVLGWAPNYHAGTMELLTEEDL